MQGAIYELKAPDGKDSGQLLKVLKFKAVLPITGNDIGAPVLNPAQCVQSTYVWHPVTEIKSPSKKWCELAGLKREWIIGQHLNKLRGPKGELQGALASVNCTCIGAAPPLCSSS